MGNAALDGKVFRDQLTRRGVSLRLISDLAEIPYQSMRRLARDPGGAPLAHALLAAEAIAVEDIEALFVAMPDGEGSS